MLKHDTKNIKHFMKHNHSYTQWKQDILINTHAYTNQHLTCITSFINGYYNCRYKLGKNTYIIENLFRNQLHRCNVPPNHRPACSLISQQHCHPRAGHDSSGERWISQANTVGFIRPSRSWERLNAKVVSSLRSQGHLHQN